jgi:hypothetical protein
MAIQPIIFVCPSVLRGTECEIRGDPSHNAVFLHSHEREIHLMVEAPSNVTDVEVLGERPVFPSWEPGKV